MTQRRLRWWRWWDDVVFDQLNSFDHGVDHLDDWLGDRRHDGLDCLDDRLDRFDDWLDPGCNRLLNNGRCCLLYGLLDLSNHLRRLCLHSRCWRLDLGWSRRRR